MPTKKIFLARIQGFCSGVATAIEIVELALKKYGTPLYVFHEIVHNTFVVSAFKSQGVIFVEDIEDVPENSRIVFSAHGISPAVIAQADSCHLKYIDATCPLVKKVHREAVRFSEEGRHVMLIGHKGHEEIIGTSGYVKPHLLHYIQSKSDIDALELPSHTPVAYVTQTTLSTDDAVVLIAELNNRFSDINGPDKKDICYATQSRQDAVKELAHHCDVILICGSPNSSNSNRLRETGERSGIPSYIIDHADDLDMNWIKDKTTIGISSGASVPEYIVNDLIKKIKTVFSDTSVESMGKTNETKVFPLPEI
jgi:4-hydroxy-3-methylbut-2-enyl diphosphate reductase